MMTSALPAKPRLNLLRLTQFPILEQLQLEEALLRADEGNWCLLNSGTSPAIVMGISGVKEKLIDQQYIKQHPVPVIRRFSGGGTVFVDPDTFFATWICNTAHINVPCCPQKVHRWAADFYQKAWPMLGMNLKENDYVIGERKWGGNAQYLCKGRWLHHTSMLWNYHPHNMRYLLMPEKVPAYRQLRNHEDFLCRLESYFCHRQQLQESLIAAVHQQFDVREVLFEAAAEVLQRPHRQATSLLPAYLPLENPR